MRHVPDAEVLELWERGRDAGPVTRSLLLLEAARPELDEAGRRALPLPDRDAALLALRAALRGPRLAGRLACPRCGETLDFELDGEELGRELDAAPRDELLLPDGLRFRVPSSADLLAVADADDAPLVLARRCCLSAPDGLQWTPATLDAVEQRMEEQGVAADLQLRLHCPACAHDWTCGLDLAAFLWEECEQHALALLDEVDRLAAAYHWSEREILALSPARRRAYLQRCAP